jgi:hypothetical protein
VVGRYLLKASIADDARSKYLVSPVTLKECEYR